MVFYIFHILPCYKQLTIHKSHYLLNQKDCNLWFSVCHNFLQDQWKTTLLLRAKNALKAKEIEEEDLT